MIPLAPKYPIGHKFLTRGKYPRLCTVTDIHTTTNADGEIVKIRYVATHDFAGQTVTDYDVVQTTIDMSEIRKANVT